jgi:hypothetical protein
MHFFIVFFFQIFIRVFGRNDRAGWEDFVKLLQKSTARCATARPLREELTQLCMVGCVFVDGGMCWEGAVEVVFVSELKKIISNW